MYHFTKIFAIAVFLTAFSGYELHNISPRDTQDAKGNFTYEGNKNCLLLGSNYTGRAVDNKNSIMKLVDSSVELVENKNMKVDIRRSTLKAYDETNSDISATSSTLELKSNKNMKINAEDAWSSFEDNKSFNFRGEGGANIFLSQFVGNENTDISGNNNRILASNNKNMKIENDNNNLKISATSNHYVRPALSGSNENTFTAKKSGTNSIKFVVEYVGSAVISGTKYQLGKIKFNATTMTNMVKVTLNGSEGVIYSVVSVTPDKIVVQAESNGITQTLAMKGERVESVDLKTYNIFVSSW